MKSIRIKNLSIKKKILLGYLLIICIILMVMFLLLGTLWKHLIKESISKSIYSSNYQIKKSIDNYFDSMDKAFRISLIWIPILWKYYGRTMTALRRKKEQ